jgi:hypothetical protein
MTAESSSEKACILLQNLRLISSINTRTDGKTVQINFDYYSGPGKLLPIKLTRDGPQYNNKRIGDVILAEVTKFVTDEQRTNLRKLLIWHRHGVIAEPKIVQTGFEDELIVMQFILYGVSLATLAYDKSNLEDVYKAAVDMIDNRLRTLSQSPLLKLIMAEINGKISDLQYGKLQLNGSHKISGYELSFIRNGKIFSFHEFTFDPEKGISSLLFEPAWYVVNRGDFELIPPPTLSELDSWTLTTSHKTDSFTEMLTLRCSMSNLSRPLSRFELSHTGTDLRHLQTLSDFATRRLIAFLYSQPSTSISSEITTFHFDHPRHTESVPNVLLFLQPAAEKEGLFEILDSGTFTMKPYFLDDVWYLDGQGQLNTKMVVELGNAPHAWMSVAIKAGKLVEPGRRYCVISKDNDSNYLGVLLYQALVEN